MYDLKYNLECLSGSLIRELKDFSEDGFERAFASMFQWAQFMTRNVNKIHGTVEIVQRIQNKTTTVSMTIDSLQQLIIPSELCFKRREKNEEAQAKMEALREEIEQLKNELERERDQSKARLQAISEQRRQIRRLKRRDGRFTMNDVKNALYGAYVEACEDDPTMIPGFDY